MKRPIRIAEGSIRGRKGSRCPGPETDQRRASSCKLQATRKTPPLGLDGLRRAATLSWLAACSLQLAACSLQLAACSLQLAACSLQLAAPTPATARYIPA
ncbi:hypothetical protein FGS76_08310 [Alloalcanivorax gelatiniphagus]|uniref:Uncharacterized protein n=1 Tax=Alloalcanivorax gelatiniphagus TaxID=1194167 RepID=A0ABY2XNI0_9GAMM|nr:hypothetical protein FGS76_08310 [Alloalcanivorax gelatiniphagus]